MAQPDPAKVAARAAAAKVRRRAGFAWGVAIVAAAMVPAIESWVFPWQLNMFLRSWGLHFFALVAGTIFTTSVLGYHRALPGRYRRTLLTIGCAVPLTITLLHELGQWIWPAGERDAFDSVRDSLLNVFGAATGWWIVRHPPADADGS